MKSATTSIFPAFHCFSITSAALYLEYWLLSSTIFHHLSLPVIAGKNEHRLVLFAGKSKHHLYLVDTCFTPTNFYVHGSQVKVHPGAHACGVCFRHEHTYAWAQPIVSIDSMYRSTMSILLLILRFILRGWAYTHTQGGLILRGGLILILRVG